MGRRKTTIPEVPVIDYKKEIADEAAKRIGLEMTNSSHNFTSFVQSAYFYTVRDTEEIEDGDRAQTLDIIIQLLRGIVCPMIRACDVNSKVDWISDFMISWYKTYGYANYLKKVDAVHNVFANAMKEHRFCEGALNDMHKGLQILSIVCIAFKKMDDLVPAINPNGKLIEVPAKVNNS